VNTEQATPPKTMTDVVDVIETKVELAPDVRPGEKKLSTSEQMQAQFYKTMTTQAKELEIKEAN